jgi:hypothetical protein
MNLPGNMLYRGVWGSRWHMGCNYLITRTTTSSGLKKEDTGLTASERKELPTDTGYEK